MEGLSLRTTVVLLCFWRSLVSARGDEFRTDAYRRYLVGQPNMACFFLFLLLIFSIIFEIFGEIKNTQIGKFHF
jgi:hypothetical protein